MTYELAGKVFMVTGSSSGIGRSTAICLARNGADIILHGRKRSAEIESVAQQIKDLGQQTHFQFADFSDINSLEPFVEEAWRWQGHVDGWINNAGGDVLTGALKACSFTEKLEYLLKTDVTATLILSRLAGRKMQASCNAAADANAATRVILNIGWDQAWQGMEGDAGELFATTKGAIMSMTKSLAQSLAPQVRVNCIAPGWIQTKWGKQTAGYWSDRAKSESLMNRWGSPDDIASAALYLVTASFVSGQVLPVNGGFRFSNHPNNTDQASEK
jgi:3-oxoacyl-[acyl-carrier protein] reductase